MRFSNRYDEVWALWATGALLFFPEGRTYSPPVADWRWYPFRWSGSCALRGDAAPAGAYGQCHTSAELLSLSTQLALCSQQRLPHFFVQQYVPTACENLPPAAFHSDGYRPGDTHFLFAKKKQKRERRDGENEWRSIIWKQK